MKIGKTWTGERLETHVTNEAMLEHLHRYAIVKNLVKGLNILDIACGEGYGTNILANYATQVTGIDIDDFTINQAGAKYNSKNIIFKRGSILNIPEPDNIFDIVICFETIEHVSDHLRALGELKRVLKPDGLLILSTPEKKYYSDESNFKNTFHEKELYELEFKSLVSDFFKYNKFYSQRSFATSLIIKDGENHFSSFYKGNYKEIEESNSFNPFFRIALASDKEVPDIQTGFFFHEKSISALLFQESEAVKKTLTYRIGQIITSPVKSLISYFKK